MKQNEFFYIPSDGLNPHEMDLQNPINYHFDWSNILVRNLILCYQDFWFRHRKHKLKHQELKE
jgi:CRISPR-associated endonuclease Csn1